MRSRPLLHVILLLLVVLTTVSCSKPNVIIGLEKKDMKFTMKDQGTCDLNRDNTHDCKVESYSYICTEDDPNFSTAFWIPPFLGANGYYKCKVNTSREGKGEASSNSVLSPIITLEFGKEGRGVSRRISYGFGSLTDDLNSDNSLNYRYLFASVVVTRIAQISKNFSLGTTLGMGIGGYDIDGTLTMCCYNKYHDNGTISSSYNKYQQHPEKDVLLTNFYFEFGPSIFDLDIRFIWSQLMRWETFVDQFDVVPKDAEYADGNRVGGAYHEEALQVSSVQITYRF